ncbi:MAG TPA: hypothetical protein VK132_01225 [Gemmatimonadales bacterium]|nr:hypothetical protein [Gemmatimonadales bacterium]
MTLQFATSAMGRMEAPQGPFDYAIAVAAGVIVVLSIILCLRYFLHPAEAAPGHIKRRVLRDDLGPRDGPPTYRSPNSAPSRPDPP